MSSAALALLIYAVYLGSAFGLRSILQRRATGSTGFKGISGRPGSPEWIAGVLFIVALVLGVAAPILALTDTAPAIAALDSTPLIWAGAILATAGTVLTLITQSAMGNSWRIGVDQAETTDLVTGGPFALVRNPIFAAMTPTGLGLVLIVPSSIALLGFAALVLALELQVRIVEEPYLIETHGQTYRDYAARVGRFVPGLGLLGSER